MRILVAVEPGEVQQSILNVLKEVPVFRPVVYGQPAIPVNEITDSFSFMIMDTGWKGWKKEHLLEVLKTGCPALQVLVLGPVQHDDQLFNWLRAGAVAAMLESEIKMSLGPILMLVQKGAPIFSAIISRQLLMTLIGRNADLLPAVGYDLTTREKDVLTCLVKGQTYKMAGLELSISPETVRGHVKNIYKKLGVGSQSQAVAVAIYNYLV
jgi:DNA-binding NarL/FixJ family response regulator